MAKTRTTKAADPKAESMPMRIPFPVDPSLLLILMTMFVPSWGVSRHGDRWSAGDEAVWWYDVAKVGAVWKACWAMAVSHSTAAFYSRLVSMIYERIGEASTFDRGRSIVLAIC